MIGAAFRALVWWQQLLAIAALFGAVWYGVHRVEEHYRDQGRTEIRVEMKKQEAAATKQVMDITKERDDANAKARELSSKLETLQNAEAADSRAYVDSILTRLRKLGGLQPQSPGGSVHLPTTADVGSIVDFAARATAAADANRNAAIRNADQVDRILAAVEQDYERYYRVRGEKPPTTPPKAAQERLQKRLEELRLLGETTVTQ